MTKVKFGAPKKVKDTKDVKKPTQQKKTKSVKVSGIKKKTEESTQVASQDYIVLGKTTAIKIVEGDKGEVQIQKYYCTNADPEWKRAKGGFNLPKDKAILKQVRLGLKRFME